MHRFMILVFFSWVLGCQKAPTPTVEQAPSTTELRPAPAVAVAADPVEGKGASVQAVEVAAKSAVLGAKSATGPGVCGSQNEGVPGEDGRAPSEEGCAPQAADKAATTNHFGGTFTLEEWLPLSTVLEDAGKYSGQTVKVRGRVAKVCKKKGCWFTVKVKETDATYVRVTMLDYGFFVPRDCDGKEAVIEGVFKQVEVPEAHRKHLAEDGGDDPSAIKGAQKEFTMVATAIDIEG